jgi:polysaccharide export outer membrane protein
MRGAAAVLLAFVLGLGAGCAGGVTRHAGPGPATGPVTTAPANPVRPVTRPPVAPVIPPVAADEDYRLAPQDQIAVTVYGQKDLTRTLRVSQSGTVTLPLLGEVRAAGLSASELEQVIEKGLRGRYLTDPRVNVTVAEFQGRRFGVLGAVNQPGEFSLQANQATLIQALSEAKGVKDTADRVAYVVRARPRPGEPQPLAVDLDALLRGGDGGQNVVLEGGDSVYVPEANSFYVAGQVEKAGVFRLRRDTTLAKALTEAGGLTKRAAPGEVKVIRTLPTGEKQELGTFDAAAAMAGDRGQDIALQAQDVVVVPRSGAKTAAYGFLDVLKSILKFSLIAF